MRGYRDRDFLFTTEGFFFCVVGHVHPSDRVLAYLKYMPSLTGKWGNSVCRFKRVLSRYSVPSLLETFRLLKAFPQYLYSSPVLNVEMSAVPLDCISTHLIPEEKVEMLLDGKELDSLQKKAVSLLTILSTESHVPIEYFGVTGSILLDIHQGFSDIDLLIYGVQNHPVVRKALLQLYQSNPAVTRFDGNVLKEWCLDKAKTYPFSEEEAAVIYRRKWGRGLIHRTKFSLHSVKLDEEVSERYGDRIYLPRGIVTISSTVADASESCFMPAVYQVDDVKFLEGAMVDDVKEVASYDGFFCDIAYPNERIVVKGKLEKVIDKRCDVEYHRVLVGSPEAMGADYIKPIDAD